MRLQQFLATSNLKTKQPLPFDILWPWISYILLLLCNPSRRRQRIDSNWFRFMESPTNISFLPLILAKKSVALNLQMKSECRKDTYTNESDKLSRTEDQRKHCSNYITASHFEEICKRNRKNRKPINWQIIFRCWNQISSKIRMKKCPSIQQ